MPCPSKNFANSVRRDVLITYVKYECLSVGSASTGSDKSPTSASCD